MLDTGDFVPPYSPLFAPDSDPDIPPLMSTEQLLENYDYEPQNTPSQAQRPRMAGKKVAKTPCKCTEIHTEVILIIYNSYCETAPCCT